MKRICSERAAYLFGLQQVNLVPRTFQRAFLRGAHNGIWQGQQDGFLDPEVEEAYKKLLSVYKTKTAVAKAIGIHPPNLSQYTSGQLPVGPKVKAKFLAAAAIEESALLCQEG